MNIQRSLLIRLFMVLLPGLIQSCQEKNTSPALSAIDSLQLKKGNLVVCGPPDKQFGMVSFEISCPPAVKKDFDLAIALLHSFEYDEAEKAFAKIIGDDPACAMAYWGVAMCNFHPLWTPPTPAELEKGAKAIALAQSLSQKTKRESDYIEAIALFYRDWNKSDHLTRCVNFEKAMEKIYREYPDDKEAAVFYAFALDGAADPADKSCSLQKKAGELLTSLYPGQPAHPGIIHYIIHSYDYPQLAALGLDAARKYAGVAPSSAHAQHMPSHIFTRLGLWDECIRSNLVSVASAKCYAESTGIKGHWDEELHGLDYLVYAYLQKGDNSSAKQQYDYLKTIRAVYPIDFKDAYAFAAIPARFFLENKMWKEAASLEFFPADFPWNKFPWQKAIVHFARLLGAVHTGNPAAAGIELKNLSAIREELTKQKDVYKANQVSIQEKMGGAWILYYSGKKEEALGLMKEAAGLEEMTQKHPVTPGEVIPATELLGDLFLQMNRPQEALESYQADLKEHPNRFNGLYGAGLAAEKSNQLDKAAFFYRQLSVITDSSLTDRPEHKLAGLFLRKHPSPTPK